MYVIAHPGDPLPSGLPNMYGLLGFSFEGLKWLPKPWKMFAVLYAYFCPVPIVLHHFSWRGCSVYYAFGVGILLLWWVLCPLWLLLLLPWLLYQLVHSHSGSHVLLSSVPLHSLAGVECSCGNCLSHHIP